MSKKAGSVLRSRPLYYLDLPSAATAFHRCSGHDLNIGCPKETCLIDPDNVVEELHLLRHPYRHTITCKGNISILCRGLATLYESSVAGPSTGTKSSYYYKAFPAGILDLVSCFFAKFQFKITHQYTPRREIFSVISLIIPYGRINANLFLQVHS